MKKKMDKRGQTTIFIIVGVVIVAAIIIFLLLGSYFNIGLNLGGDVDVNKELTSCILDNQQIDEKIGEVMVQGGMGEPQNSISYDGMQIEYLCYTGNYLETCYMQKPFLLNSAEEEIKKIVEDEFEKCVDDLESRASRRGYTVSRDDANVDVMIVPEYIDIKVDMPLTLKKDGSQTFNEFEIKKPSKYYDLLIISSSILNYEARLGDADILSYMALYPDIEILKKRQGEDGSKVYLVRERNSGEEFNFAVRSLVFPVGYNL